MHSPLRGAGENRTQGERERNGVYLPNLSKISTSSFS
jgi:hypothetical protein